MLRSPPEGKTASGNATSSFPSITCRCNREVFLAPLQRRTRCGREKPKKRSSITLGPFQLAGPLQREIESRGSLLERRRDHTRQAILSKKIGLYGRKVALAWPKATFRSIIHQEGGLSLLVLPTNDTARGASSMDANRQTIDVHNVFIRRGEIGWS